MATKYVKIKISDINQEILGVAVSKNIYNLKKKTVNECEYTLLEFEEVNVPVDLYILGYALMSKTEALEELDSGGWG